MGAAAADIRAAYHFSPLETRAVAKLARSTRASILLATPTFLRGYLRRCEPEELKSLEIVVAGAEKLPPVIVRSVRAEVRRAAGRRVWHDGALAAGVGQRAAEPIAKFRGRLQGRLRRQAGAGRVGESCRSRDARAVAAWTPRACCS